jgi:hypothetical protein
MGGFDHVNHLVDHHVLEQILGLLHELGVQPTFGSHLRINSGTTSCRRDLCHSCMTAPRFALLLPGRTVSVMLR